VTDYLERSIGSMPPNYAEAFDETSMWGARFGALLFDSLELRPVRAGLDVGCATGFPLIELAQIHGASSRWVGIDVWADALRRAERKIEILGLKNVTVKVADASSMPFPDASFDLITSNLGINNFDDPAAVMRECARVATPGARIALTTNITGHMKEMYDLLRAVARDRAAAIDEQERHRGSLESISRLLSDGGFEVRRHVQRNFSLKYADGSAMLRHSLVHWFLAGWRPAIGADRERDVFAEVERRLNERGPLQFTVPALYVEAVRRR
jgi:arsenite methyltransferase